MHSKDADRHKLMYKIHGFEISPNQRPNWANIIPMKILILFICFSTSLGAQTNPKVLLCTYKNAKVVVAIAKAHSHYDKNLHCSVSCMLTLRCNSGEVLLAGLFKELKDLLGYGNAEVKDLEADFFGVDLVRSKRATTDQECLEQCDLQY